MAKSGQNNKRIWVYADWFSLDDAELMGYDRLSN